MKKLGMQWQKKECANMCVCVCVCVSVCVSLSVLAVMVLTVFLSTWLGTSRSIAMETVKWMELGARVIGKCIYF